MIKWIKDNTYEASLGTSSKVACGGIFRKHLASHVDSLACFLGRGNSILWDNEGNFGNGVCTFNELISLLIGV